METWEIRRNNLGLLIEKIGSIVKLNELLGRKRNDSIFNQIRNKTPYSKTGDPRKMGDGLARQLELKLSLGSGWMDVPHRIEDLETVIGYRKSEKKSKIKIVLGGEGVTKEAELLDLSDIFFKSIFNLTSRENIVGFLIQDNTIGEIAPLGSIVLVDTGVNVFQRDGVYLFKVSNQLMLRYVSFSLDGVYTIKKDSKEQQAYKSLDSFSIAGMARYIWKGQAL